MLKNCMNRVRGSLTVRIFLITAFILFAACGMTYGFIAWATPITYQSIETDALSEKLDVLVNELQDETLESCGPLLDRFIAETGASVVVTDQAGNEVNLPTTIIYERAADGIVEDKPLRDVIITTTTEGNSATASTEERVSSMWDAWDAWGGLAVAVGSVAIFDSDWDVPFTFKDSDEVYQLMVIANVTAVNQTVEAMNHVLPWLVLVVLAISLLGALFYSRYITKPIVRLSEVSQKMAELDFSWVSQEKRTDEIGILGRNLNELSGSLSAALTELQAANAALQADIDREREMERQRAAFFSAASHELKTPITVLKGQLSGMLAGVDIYQDRDKYLARSLAVTGRMEKLVQEMLTISRMGRSGNSFTRAAVDFSKLVRSQLTQAEDLAIQREQTMNADISGWLTVNGSEMLLERAVANLLINALTYSPPGSSISVRLYEAVEGTSLSIENSGAHIPAEALPHLFEAFYRVESSRNRDTGGSGLGLYLTRMILDRHAATCTIENTEYGVRATAMFHPSKEAPAG